MKVGDLVRIKDTRSHSSYVWGKIGIVVICGTWSVDVRILDGTTVYGLCPRIAKKDCEVISASV